jgi:hypothetical protein
MRTIKTYRKVGAFYIAWEADFSTPIRLGPIFEAQVLTVIAARVLRFRSDEDGKIGGCGYFPEGASLRQADAARQLSIPWVSA